MFILLILIVSILLFTLIYFNVLRKAKIHKSKNLLLIGLFVSVAIIVFLIINSLVIYFPEYKSLQCGDTKFSFQKSVKGTESFTIYGGDWNLDLNKVSNSFVGINPRLVLTFVNYDLDNDKLSSEYKLLRSNEATRKANVIKKLLDCKGYDNDVIYSVGKPKSVNENGFPVPDSNGNNTYLYDRYCYIANYSKVTDYPDCSSEIKAKFGI